MGTLSEWWTAPYPEVASARTATDYIDALGGSLSRRLDNGGWVLSTGEQELVRADTPAELDTFVLGFALAHVICERHGLIGRRQGPSASPGPAEAMAQAGGMADAAASPEGADGTEVEVNEVEVVDVLEVVEVLEVVDNGFEAADGVPTGDPGDTGDGDGTGNADSDGGGAAVEDTAGPGAIESVGDEVRRFKEKRARKFR